MTMFDFAPHFTQLKPKRWNGRDKFALAEEKYDGIRLSVGKDWNGRVSAFSRKKDIDYADRLTYCGITFNSLPEGSIVDGELVAPGGTSTDVQTALNNRDAEFWPFAMPVWEGRRQAMSTLLRNRNLIRCVGEPPAASVVLTEKRMLEMIDEQQVEGFVLKTLAYVGWMKIKGVETHDVIAVRYLEGGGRLAGTLGSIEIAAYVNGTMESLGRVGTGFDDETRDRLWRERPDVIEITHEGRLSRGGLRFPRFVRERFDKPKEECIW